MAPTQPPPEVSTAVKTALFGVYNPPIKPELPYPPPLPPLTGAALASHEWNEDELSIHSVSQVPVRLDADIYMAAIFDLRLRRWYQIYSPHVPPEVTEENPDALWNDPYWFDVLRRTGHRARSDFNEVEVIRSTVDGSESLVTRLNATGIVGTPIYSLRRRSTIPACSDPAVQVAPLHKLTNRRYLSQSVESCSWPGFGAEDVAFKQILQGFGESTRLYREIALLRHLQLKFHHHSACDSDKCSHSRSPFLPLIACVIDEIDFVRGFLTPHGGTPLNMLPKQFIKATVFLDVLRGLVTLHTIPRHLITSALRDPTNNLTSAQQQADRDEKDNMVMVQHGDICPRNVLINESTGNVCLIDVGNSPLEYPGDRLALVEMMRALRSEPGASTEAEERAMDEIVGMLRDGEPFEEIIGAFEWRLERTSHL
jgi:hypothetical protein